METKVNVPFECIMTFSDSNNIPAMVVRQVTDIEQHYVVSASSGVRIQPSGAVFNVEYTQTDDKLRPPAVFDKGWRFVHIGGTGKVLRTLFLAKLYMVLARVAVPAEPFKDPELDLIDSLYKYINGTSIHESLAADNYHYQRRSYYARFDNDLNVSYNIPRSMKYFPQEKIVVVTWYLDDGLPKGKPTPESLTAMMKASSTGVRIQRAYTNEPWVPLRKLAQSDPKVGALVTTFIESGFLKQQQPQAK